MNCKPLILIMTIVLGITATGSLFATRDDRHPVHASRSQKPHDQRIIHDEVANLRIIGVVEKTSATGLANYGQTVTYTILIRDLPVFPGTTVYMFDTVPAGLSYLTHTLTATLGTITDTTSATLEWSSPMSNTSIVTIAYAITVSANSGQFISNTVSVFVPGDFIIQDTAILLVNGHLAYLPCLERGN